MTLKELREKQGKIASDIKKLADKQNESPDEWIQEDENRWTELNSDYNKNKELIQKQERSEEIKKELEETTNEDGLSRTDLASKEYSDYQKKQGHMVTERDHSLALQGWCLHNADMDEEIRDEHREAAEKVGVKIDRKFFDVQLEKRTDNYESTADGYGGYTIPEGFVQNLEVALLKYGGIRKYANVIRTATGNDLVWPTSDDTSNKGSLLAEYADSDDSAASHGDISTSAQTLKAYKISSNMIRVTEEIMTDSAFDFAAFLGARVGERIARKEAEYFATGTGSSRPTGLVGETGNGGTLGVTAASSTALDTDEILELIYSVDGAYRPNGTFVMNDNVLLAIRKLKDGQGQYLWQQGLKAGEPDRILGYPVVSSSDMSSTITTGDKVMVFGDLKKFIIRDVGSVRMRRLLERYAEYDQEGFVGFKRVDSQVLDAGTNPIKWMAMA